MNQAISGRKFPADISAYGRKTLIRNSLLKVRKGMDSHPLLLKKEIAAKAVLSFFGGEQGILLSTIESATGTFSQSQRLLRCSWSSFLIPCCLKQKNTQKGVFLFWRRARDSNPRVGFDPLHDFQSCSFGQLGQLSKYH